MKVLGILFLLACLQFRRKKKLPKKFIPRSEASSAPASVPSEGLTSSRSSVTSSCSSTSASVSRACSSQDQLPSAGSSLDLKLIDEFTSHSIKVEPQEEEGSSLNPKAFAAEIPTNTMSESEEESLPEYIRVMVSLLYFLDPFRQSLKEKLLDKSLPAPSRNKLEILSTKLLEYSTFPLRYEDLILILKQGFSPEYVEGEDSATAKNLKVRSLSLGKFLKIFEETLFKQHFTAISSPAEKNQFLKFSPSSLENLFEATQENAKKFIFSDTFDKPQQTCMSNPSSCFAKYMGFVVTTQDRLESDAFKEQFSQVLSYSISVALNYQNLMVLNVYSLKGFLIKDIRQRDSLTGFVLRGSRIFEIQNLMLRPIPRDDLINTILRRAMKKSMEVLLIYSSTDNFYTLDKTSRHDLAFSKVQIKVAPKRNLEDPASEAHPSTTSKKVKFEATD